MLPLKLSSRKRLFIRVSIQMLFTPHPVSHRNCYATINMEFLHTVWMPTPCYEAGTDYVKHPTEFGWRNDVSAPAFMYA
jgi:hypothetical protein